jgi:hypothetical protein
VRRVGTQPPTQVVETAEGDAPSDAVRKLSPPVRGRLKGEVHLHSINSLRMWVVDPNHVILLSLQASAEVVEAGQEEGKKVTRKRKPRTVYTQEMLEALEAGRLALPEGKLTPAKPERDALSTATGLSVGQVKTRWVTRRARWVTLRARWVSVMARW